MIYIASAVSRAVAATKEFIAKGLEGLTVGKIGDVTVYGCANEHQLAYDGYKNNTEAFILATTTKSKVLTNQEAYSFPLGYEVKAPLVLPNVVFRVAKGVPAEVMEKMKESLASEGIEEVGGKDHDHRVPPF